MWRTSERAGLDGRFDAASLPDQPAATAPTTDARPDPKTHPSPGEVLFECSATITAFLAIAAVADLLLWALGQ